MTHWQLRATQRDVRYFDQNESFAHYLPIEGVISKRCTASTGPDDWYLVELDEPIDYQQRVGPHFQFKRLVVRRVLIRSRWSGVPISRDTSPSVFLLLVGEQQAVPCDALLIEDFVHACWASCHVQDSA